MYKKPNKVFYHKIDPAHFEFYWSMKRNEKKVVKKTLNKQ